MPKKFTPFKKLAKKLALYGISLLAFGLSSMAYANPEGGQVVGGAATIKSSGKKLDVHQHTDRTAIDWRSFDIKVDEHTQFHQPSNSATALNRVNTLDPSRIMGQLTANGNVVLVNPNGVFFGKDSKVDVNGLIATAADISTQDFMAGGKLHFNKPGAPDAAIVNAGTITAKEAGLVALVAPNVANHGVIEAKMGRVELASGDSVVVDFHGDGLYELKVSDAVMSQIVSNTGTINAEGGTIAITAAAGKKIVHSLLTIAGELKAPVVAKKGGKIIIAAAGVNAVAGNKVADKGKKQGKSIVLISNAHLDASGRDVGEQGGEIEITADIIGLLSNTLIDASGHSASVPTLKSDVSSDGTATLTVDKQVRGEEEFLAHENRAGGSIKIGGDYLGKGDTAAAQYVYVNPESVIVNDALESGDGGRVIVWSDDLTRFYGRVFARGGSSGGNGGFLETSGKKNLDAQGYANLTSADGYKKGTYLLDPDNIVIYGHVDPLFQSTNGEINLNNDIKLWLDASDSTKIELKFHYDQTELPVTQKTLHEVEYPGNLTIWGGIVQKGAKITFAADSVTASNGITKSANEVSGDKSADGFYTVQNVELKNTKTIITTLEPLQGDVTGHYLLRAKVTQWQDKSGNGHHASTYAMSMVHAPIWIEKSQNDLSTIYFDDNASMDINDALNLGHLEGDAKYSIYAMFAYLHPHVLPIGGIGQVLTGVDSVWTLGSYLAKVTHWAGWSGDYGCVAGHSCFDADDNFVTIEPGKYYMTAATNDGSNSNLYVDGEDRTINSEYTKGPGRLRLGHGGGSLHYTTAYSHVPEVIIYQGNMQQHNNANAVSTNSRHLIEQYQADKWNIELQTPSDVDGTEAERAMASDGFSVFAENYLERLSATADIMLQAENDINLDLKGSTLIAADGRSITLRTTLGNINTLSDGALIAPGGGNISFITDGDSSSINIDHALNLAADGVIIFDARGDSGSVNINPAGALTVDTTNFHVTADNFVIEGTLQKGGASTAFRYQQATGGRTLDIGDGGSSDTVLSGATMEKLKAGNFDSYIFGRSDGSGSVTNYGYGAFDVPITFLTYDDFTNKANMEDGNGTILVKAGRDVILDALIATQSSEENALVLSAEGNFINNIGSDVLAAPNSRWLVYSNEPIGNIRNDLLPVASEFGKAYDNRPPKDISNDPAGSRFVYAGNARPVLTYQIDSDTVEYGDAYTGTPTITYLSGLVSDDVVDRNDPLIGNIGQTGAISPMPSSYTVGNDVGTYYGEINAMPGSLATPLGYQYTFMPGSLIVTKAPLTFLAGDVTMVDGNPVPAFTTASITGFKLGQDENFLSAPPTPYKTNYQPGISGAGSYTIFPGDGSDKNYSFELEAADPRGTLTVLPATIIGPPLGDTPADIDAITQSVLQQLREQLALGNAIQSKVITLDGVRYSMVTLPDGRVILTPIEFPAVLEGHEDEIGQAITAVTTLDPAVSALGDLGGLGGSSLFVGSTMFDDLAMLDEADLDEADSDMFGDSTSGDSIYLARLRSGLVGVHPNLVWCGYLVNPRGCKLGGHKILLMP